MELLKDGKMGKDKEKIEIYIGWNRYLLIFGSIFEFFLVGVRIFIVMFIGKIRLYMLILSDEICYIY